MDYMSFISLLRITKYAILTCFIFSGACYAGTNNISNNAKLGSEKGFILLFVSLGMPDDALKSYLLQAKQYHIPVLIRGLYTSKNDTAIDKNMGSFKDTATRIFNLLKTQKTDDLSKNNKNNLAALKKTMGGVSINPLLFRSFNITAVPALVITNNSECITNNHQKYNNVACPMSDFDVVFGNIPIKKELKIITEQSDNTMRVNLALNRLKTYQPKQQ